MDTEESKKEINHDQSNAEIISEKLTNELTDSDEGDDGFSST